MERAPGTSLGSGDGDDSAIGWRPSDCAGDCGCFAGDRGCFVGDCGCFAGELGEGPIFRIPVCYEREFAPDLAWVAGQKGLTSADIVALHSSRTYLVYMVGFLPGFPYMGKLDPLLEIQRKERPVLFWLVGLELRAYKQEYTP